MGLAPLEDESPIVRSAASDSTVKSQGGSSPSLKAGRKAPSSVIAGASPAAVPAAPRPQPAPPPEDLLSQPFDDILSQPLGEAFGVDPLAAQPGQSAGYPSSHLLIRNTAPGGGNTNLGRRKYAVGMAPPDRAGHQYPAGSGDSVHFDVLERRPDEQPFPAGYPEPRIGRSPVPAGTGRCDARRADLAVRTAETQVEEAARFDGRASSRHETAAGADVSGTGAIIRRRRSPGRHSPGGRRNIRPVSADAATAAVPTPVPLGPRIGRGERPLQQSPGSVAAVPATGDSGADSPDPNAPSLPQPSDNAASGPAGSSEKGCTGVSRTFGRRAATAIRHPGRRPGIRRVEPRITHKNCRDGFASCV